MCHGYYGGYKNGKEHGLGVYMFYERGYAGLSSYCDISEDWHAYIDG